MPNIERKLGDCLEVMKEIEDNSIDTVITDPPYGLSKEPDMAEVLSHWLAGDDYEHRGGGFMGKSWDSFVPGPSVWKEVFRVMKPGACLMAFGGTRTVDLLSIAIRLAGFRKFDEIDYYYGGLPPQIAWVYGQGFPKSLNISKKLDLKVPAAPGRRAISYRETIPAETDQLSKWHVQAGLRKHQGSLDRVKKQEHTTTSKEPATDAAALWDGWGTALKPAHEIILCFYKSREGTYANNALTWDVAGLWVDGGKIGTGDDRISGGSSGLTAIWNDNGDNKRLERPAGGRWPANLILSHTPDCRLVGTKKVKGQGPTISSPTAFGLIDDDNWEPKPTYHAGHADEDGKETVEVWECAPNCPIRLLDEQSGKRSSGYMKPGQQRVASKELGGYHDNMPNEASATGTYGDTGGASRFFYCAKVSPAERNEGMGENKNKHPTVKPLALIRYLTRLTRTPTGGIVLDPFMGSGTGGIACLYEDRDFIGIDNDIDSFVISGMRIKGYREKIERESEGKT